VDFYHFDDIFTSCGDFLMIDSEWFSRQLENEGRSMRDLAKALGLDPSSVSRMLRGERKMSADEQDGIALYLGLPLADVAARRRGDAQGFAERGQERLKMDVEIAGPLIKTGTYALAPENATDRLSGAGEKSFYERVRGCMKGTVTIPPGVDLTEPTDPEWAKVYDDD
jgi:transcriptional regulator with XRE-family HTH domain